MHSTCVHFHVARLINQYPSAYSEVIFRKTLKENILGSKHTFYKTLNYMEARDIIVNPAVTIKNHANYTSRFYFIEVEDEKTALEELIDKYRGYIDVVFAFSSLKSSFLYIAAHEKLDVEGNLILEDSVAEYRVIFPCKEHEKYPQRVLPPSVLNPKFTRKERLGWDEKMWEIYYWLRVNFRLYNSEIGKQVGLDPVTVARRKKKMLPSLYVHYPMYAEGRDNYSTILFILEDTPDLDKLLASLSDLSATSHLIRGSKGTYLCFASTRRTHPFISKMREVTQNESLKFVHPSRWWNPILDDYEKGKVEERYFYMFPPHSK